MTAVKPRIIMKETRKIFICNNPVVQIKICGIRLKRCDKGEKQIWKEIGHPFRYIG